MNISETEAISRHWLESQVPKMIELNWTSATAMGIPFIGGFAGSLVTRSNMDNFYRVWWPDRSLIEKFGMACLSGSSFSEFEEAVVHATRGRLPGGVDQPLLADGLLQLSGLQRRWRV